MRRKLILFAKAPQLGKVKTRLATHLSLEACAELHSDLVWNTLENVSSIASSPLQCDIELHCSPSTDHAFFQKCSREFPITLKTQYGADLGDRMYHALSKALRSSEQVILIGTDCPMMNEQYIKSAFSSLSSGLNADCDLVLGPARDGGYVLIGATRICPTIFDRIQWSTSKVLEQTLTNIESMDWGYDLLATMRDVDTYQDLTELSQYEDLGIPAKKYLLGLGGN